MADSIIRLDIFDRIFVASSETRLEDGMQYLKTGANSHPRLNNIKAVPNWKHVVVIGYQN
jgi:hypothetical protein